MAETEDLPETLTASDPGSGREIVQMWYPNYLSQTYCVPHVHMNKVPYRTELFGEQKVLVLKPVDEQSQLGSSQQTSQSKDTVPVHVQESDIIDDFAQQHMLFCLNKLGESLQPNPMFIIAKLKFKDFLLKVPFSSRPKLPQGEFDILTVSPRGGLGIGEIKSIGYKFGILNRTEAQCIVDIAKRLVQAMPRLKQKKPALEKMIASCAPNVPIRPFLMLPYVTRNQLRQAVQSADPTRNLKKDLCQWLGANDVQEATDLCVCSDDVSDRKYPWDLTPTILSKLDKWFLRRFETSHQPMSDDEYLDVIASLAGPDTAIYVYTPTPPRLEVRTVSQAVSHVGERMRQIVLTPDQVNLLNEAPPLAWLTGPPGTGKTITLVVQALVWLRKGFDVHVVSTRRHNIAAASMVHHQLKETLRSYSAVASTAAGVPLLHLHNFVEKEGDADEALEKLRKFAESKNQLHVIIDEYSLPVDKYEEIFRRFLDGLIHSVSQLCLWGTSLHRDPPSGQLKQFSFTEPLRCPPVVQREVKPAVEHYSRQSQTVDEYSDRAFPAPSDGPPVIWLSHSGREHSDPWPVQCRQCGLDVAELLKNKLGVGKSDNDSEDPRVPPLSYRDVMVLTFSSELKDSSELGDAQRSDSAPESAEAAATADASASSGRETVAMPSSSSDQSDQVCGFVKGLRSKGIKVQVLPWRHKTPATSEDKKVLEDIAMAKNDVVTVTDAGWVRGLERKVIVLLPGRHAEYQQEEKCDREVWERGDKLDAMSRCTSQLIVVECPGSYDTRDTAGEAASQS